MDEPADGPDALIALWRAVADEPDAPGHHANLGAALHALGRHDEAIVAHRRALAALAVQRAALLYNLGATLAETGRLDEAAAAYEDAVRARPGWVLALDNLGTVRQQQGRAADAERAYRDALAAEPDHAPTRYNLGALRHAAGDHAEAVAHFRAALAAAPGSAAIEHGLALALTGQGQLAEAITAQRRALAAEPALPEGHAQLALLLLRTGDPAAALAAAEDACAVSPDDAGAHGIRGAALATLARHAEAAEAYDRARSLAPDRVEVHFNCALGAEALGDRDAAVTAYRDVLAREPQHRRALDNLTRVLIEQGRDAEALAPCEQLIALDPDSPLLQHQLAALRGETPPAPPRAYVVEMFDGMAPRFDALLVDTLEYRVPVLLRAALERHAPGRRFAHALDLGCGTGLTGVQLRPITDVLHGIDLSPRMIDAATARGIYDALYLAELVEFLEETDTRYDLITATDVLIYLGDLGPLFGAARDCLAGGGLLACSVERDDGVDVRLAATGRYHHGRAYLEGLAADHELDVLGFDAIDARLEAGRPVPSWLFVLSAGRARSAARGRARRPRHRRSPAARTRA